MFCPRCGAEYRDGFTVCADCGVDLVVEKPSTGAEFEYVEYVELVRTYNPVDIAIIRSLLDANRIVYYMRGENFGNIRPLADPVSVMVEKQSVERAIELIKPLNLRLRWISGS